jgi:hypothetical protein
MSKKQFAFYVAGLKFHMEDYEKAKDHIEIGHHCQLDRDPENPYDPNAVKIVYNFYNHETGNIDPCFLGHVPMKMKQSALVSQALLDCQEDHEAYSCIITKHFPDAPPYERLKVEVTFNG